MGSIKQAVSWWCFANRGMTPRELLQASADIGYQAVELIEPEYWPLVKEFGLTIASTNGGLSIERGLNRREHHAQLERDIRATIEQAEKWSIPNVIVFSGNRQGLDDRTGAEITAEGLSRVARIAEDAGVTLVMELLNSKVDHPDYQCDKSAWGIEVCRMVNSPRVKLLYDIYHMQIMEGDIIRTIQDHHTYFAHYHTAGNPGRHELDETQELNYPPIVRTILATGYEGYLGQEFVPLGDPLTALKQAFALCNVKI
ncbi:hydroxypyruvate isomerase [Ktedonobacter sp. SOSP1-85]|uniref:hydroxypyruvate isomerase family protein n=1 Tax=Ktedonobacter sp. SOSP1-85 TaxID=2778367 RepID=UPI0019161676|nr:TIM barrel protein [Ktedonobacter sp. SOSP1-85]GHO78513.1 hydroxypyruvate isomerase [Ktedonobacter sp. SOSP1-85]